jgi:hypothetical protein
MELIQINPSQYGLEETKATELIGNLPAIKAERGILETQYSEVITLDIELPETSKTAKELRLKIRDNRTKGIEVWHKTTKDFFLKGGQFVDAIKRMEVAVNERMEGALEEIEKYAENKEKQRIADLQKAREIELQPYNVENISSLNLGNMPATLWEGFLKGCQIKHAEKIESERLAAEAEAQRIEEEKAERERVRLENERLKAEAEAKAIMHKERGILLRPYIEFIGDYDTIVNLPENDFETRLSEIKQAAEKQWEFDTNEAIRKQSEAIAKEKELAAERARVEAERKLAEESLRIEREAAAEELRKQNESARIEREKIEKENARIAAELKAKQDAELAAERKRLAEEEAARKEAIKAAKAPVKTKLTVWVDGFVMGAPIGLSEDQTVKDVLAKFEAFKAWAKNQIELI